LERFLELARPFTGGRDDANVLALVKDKVKLLKELPERTNYFFTEDYPFEPSAVEKLFTAPDTVELLKKLTDKFVAVSSWTAGNLETALKSLATETGRKTADYIHPCRVAVSGTGAGPSLYHMLEVLGRERVLARLRRFNASTRQPFNAS
jgi:glutamyl/glutaminyl-tRNA synthetase